MKLSRLKSSTPYHRSGRLIGHVKARTASSKGKLWSFPLAAIRCPYVVIEAAAEVMPMVAGGE